MGKRYCGGLGSEFKYFLIVPIASVVGMIERHLSFFSSQILMSPRSKSISLVRMIATSHTRSPTDKPSRMSASSRMFSIAERRFRICASVKARLGCRLRLRTPSDLPSRLAGSREMACFLMSYCHLHGHRAIPKSRRVISTRVFCEEKSRLRGWRFLAPLPRNLNLHKFLTANIPRAVCILEMTGSALLWESPMHGQRTP